MLYLRQEGRGKRADAKFADDRVLLPDGIVAQVCFRHCAHAAAVRMDPVSASVWSSPSLRVEACSASPGVAVPGPGRQTLTLRRPLAPPLAVSGQVQAAKGAT